MVKNPQNVGFSGHLSEPRAAAARPIPGRFLSPRPTFFDATEPRPFWVTIYVLDPLTGSDAVRTVTHGIICPISRNARLAQHVRTLQLELAEASGLGRARPCGVLALYLAKGWLALMDWASVGISFLAGALGWYAVIFLWNLALAPSRLWGTIKRITDLSNRLEPRLSLSFNLDTCDRWLSRGAVSEVYGKAINSPARKGASAPFLFKYTIPPSLPVLACKESIEHVDHDDNRANVFFEPVELIWIAESGDCRYTSQHVALSEDPCSAK